ncbi:hypothetical protein A2U01_0089683, partial [Trifolium medium]|nr:hypothetical protein [Trifolium medium]
MINQSLVGSVLIGAEFSREGMTKVRFPATAIGMGLEPLDSRTDPRTRLNW